MEQLPRAQAENCLVQSMQWEHGNKFRLLTNSSRAIDTGASAPRDLTTSVTKIIGRQGERRAKIGEQIGAPWRMRSSQEGCARMAGKISSRFTVVRRALGAVCDGHQEEEKSQRGSQVWLTFWLKFWLKSILAQA